MGGSFRNHTLEWYLSISGELLVRNFGLCDKSSIRTRVHPLTKDVLTESVAIFRNVRSSGVPIILIMFNS